MPTPEVTLIIPTRQRREALRRLLLSLSTQTAPSGSYEVVVCVDGSTDGTWEMLQAARTPYRLRAVPSARRGRAAACNVGLAAASAEIVIILDDDMQVVPEFVDRHKCHHDLHPRRCVLGAVPVILHEASPRAASFIQRKFAAHLGKLAQPDYVFGIRDFYSGNASMRTETLIGIGGFDEAFATYGNEDVELSVRLHTFGVAIVYEPRAVARQEYTKDLLGLGRDTVEKGGTAVLLARKHPEIFGSLRLASAREGPRAWLATRSILLALVRHRIVTPEAIFRLGAVFERAGLWRDALVYRSLLDFAFWTGVDRELAGQPKEVFLRTLRSDIRRDPIAILLHR